MNTTERVREYLKGCDLRRAQSPSVASAFCMSQTTLMRRLRAEGTNFHTLIEAERKSRLCAYMAENGRLAYGKRVIALLGYTELNSLYRAFRRWYGVDYQDVRMGRVEL